MGDSGNQTSLNRISIGFVLLGLVTASVVVGTGVYLIDSRASHRSDTLIVFGLGSLVMMKFLGVAVWVRRRMIRHESAYRKSVAEAERYTVERDQAESGLALTVQRLAGVSEELEHYSHAAAHELRTPLRVIGGYAELIERELANDEIDHELVRRWAACVLAGYERMGRRMDDLADVSRVAPEPAPVVGEDTRQRRPTTDGRSSTRRRVLPRRALK